MTRTVFRFACACAMALTGLSTALSASPQTMLRWDDLAERIVHQMDPQPGERTLIVARPGRFDPLVPLLREKLGARGAIELGAVATRPPQPENWRTEFTRNLRGRSRRELATLLADVDVALMLPGAIASDPVYDAMQDVLRQDRGRTVHFHWAGTYAPTMEVLGEDPMVDAAVQRAILEVNYGAIAAHQRRFATAMRSAPTHVTTPAGTNLTFQTRGRPASRQDGDASAHRMAYASTLIDREVELPAGAVRVAPVESTVNGVIVFPPSLWNGSIVEGLRMTFENGKVMQLEAESGLEHAEAVLARGGESARSFREFVLGFNPELGVIDGTPPRIPYYGYGAGIVRLSLGDNQELGGDVTGGFTRWNLFTDATVRVGEVTWVQDGVLTPPAPPSQ